VSGCGLQDGDEARRACDRAAARLEYVFAVRGDQPAVDAREPVVCASIEGIARAGTPAQNATPKPHQSIPFQHRPHRSVVAEEGVRGALTRFRLGGVREGRRVVRPSR